MKRDGYKEISQGIYWVGTSNNYGELQCNPYLIVDGDEAVLIDPGSALDFEIVYENVTSLVSLEKIKYIILNHQDPDLCSSVTLFENKGLKAKVVTHWRTALLIKYYGIKSDFYIVNENGYRLTLDSGRIIEFLQTPYLHFPGAIVTYDVDSRILFSSDLFGALSNKGSFYADENYIESMKAFHEHYMPGHEVLGPVMETFYKMDIKIIAPQHGAIIKDNIYEYIRILRDLECGSFLNPIKKDLYKSGGYLGVCNQVLKRLYSVFNKKEVIELFKDKEIALDEESGLIKDFNYSGVQLWDNFFKIIYTEKGIEWIVILQPLIEKLVIEYDIETPSILRTTIIQYQEKSETLKKENEELKSINERLKSNIREAEDKLLRCPLTKLYNETFFENYMLNEIKVYSPNENHSVLLINIDNIVKINLEYGNDFGDETLKNISYILQEIKEDNHLIFKIDGPNFAYYVPNCSIEESVKIAERLRNRIEQSEIFIEHVTVSVGVVGFEEFNFEGQKEEDVVENILNTARLRVRIAKRQGMNRVCSISTIDDFKDVKGKVLIVDTDIIGVQLLKSNLEVDGYEVFMCNNGKTALEIVQREHLDLIISEIMIPKIDGFMLREKMLAESYWKSIPFIIVSHLKNEESILRALSLKVEHYFKKPYTFTELYGLIKMKLKGE